MKKLSFLGIFILVFSGAFSQKKDSMPLHRRSLENSMYANEDTLTRNDYLQSFGKVFQMLNKSSSLEEKVPVIIGIADRMVMDDSSLSIIKDRLFNNERTLNVRYLQMFDILLSQIQNDTRNYADQLHKYDSTLDKTKSELLTLRKDTVIRHIFRDSALKAAFRPQLLELRTKWFYADSSIKQINILIDNTLAQTSDNMIAASELQIQTENLESTLLARVFGKERSYLWEQNAPRKNLTRRVVPNFTSEQKLTSAYFSHTHFQFNLIYLTGILFFLWVFINFRSLTRRDKLDALSYFNFHYIHKFPLSASLIFMLSLAPLFDLNAPVIYVEFIALLLLIILSFYLFKRTSKKYYYLWILFLLLFFSSFTRFFGLPFTMTRWLYLVVNSFSLLLGVHSLYRFKKSKEINRILYLTILLYTVFNLLGIICNLSGRVTLMQILSATANYAIIQTITLLVFKGIVTEALLLQIQTSRIRKQYPEEFDFEVISKRISRMLVIVCVIIWTVVFLTNMNLFTFISDKIAASLTEPRVIGSFNFTYGGIALFLAIMWSAYFLQKYISYFFGDIGDDAAFNSKGPRSRLLITRLLLLIGGFLLAIAASGLPVDRITVVLGALGVGIGLGLQSIVNNFVSGIILIFDRTLRIGDTVEIGDKKGRVKEISIRSSTLLTPDGAEIIIPNGDILSHNIVNWTLSNNNIRVEIALTIDTQLPESEIKTAINEILLSSTEVMAKKESEIFIDSISSKSTQLKIYFWCKDVTKTEMARSEIYAAIYKFMESKGIKIL